MDINVTLPYDPDWRALAWAKKNCPSYITNRGIVSGKVTCYSGNDIEAMMFRLKWA